MTFYERLTELRKEKVLTQKQIVDELDLGKNSFGDWKRGIIPVRSTQQLLAKYFGVSVDYLMGKTNNPIPNTEKVGTYIPVSYTHLDVYKRQAFKDNPIWQSSIRSY